MEGKCGEERKIIPKEREKMGGSLFSDPRSLETQLCNSGYLQRSFNLKRYTTSFLSLGILLSIKLLVSMQPWQNCVLSSYLKIFCCQLASSGSFNYIPLNGANSFPIYLLTFIFFNCVTGVLVVFISWDFLFFKYLNQLFCIKSLFLHRNVWTPNIVS